MNQRLADKISEQRFDFAIWGFVCLFIALVGFWPSYVTPLAAGMYHSPSPVMTWHVLSTTLWLVLLVSQPWLIQQSRIDLHRRIGIFGAVVAIGVVLTGVALQLDLMRAYAAKGDRPNAILVPFIRFSLLFGYAVCVGLAIALRKQPAWHKRLILLGTFPLLQSAFDRMTGNVFGLPEIRGLVASLGHFMLMFLFVTWDRWRLGYFHPVTKWGSILMGIFYLIAPSFGRAKWWQELAAYLAGR